jgi:hypothetical protein
MQHSQFSDEGDRFDRLVFCKAGVATAVGVVGVGLGNSVRFRSKPVGAFLSSRSSGLRI